MTSLVYLFYCHFELHPPKSDFSDQAGIPFLKVYNIREQRINFNYKPQYISKEYHSTKGKRSCLIPGDVIMNIVGPPLGKIAIIPNNFPEYNCNQAIVFFRPLKRELNRYLYLYLCSHRFLADIELIGTAGQDNISVTKSRSIIVPLPPIAEQKRIVAKIDQLMARCDELERLRIEREQKRLTLHTAALNRFLTAPSNNDFTDAWQFITRHFNHLYSVKENVAELRKAILQLAVMGKLVPQDPTDPPASELLAEIAAEKQRFIKEKKIKKAKLLPEIKPEEIPYGLPKGWNWSRLGDVTLSTDSGWSPQCFKRERNADEWGVLKVSSVSWGQFKPNENKALPSTKEPRYECEVRSGDVLISRANTEELVARSVVVSQTPPKLMMSDKIVRFLLSNQVDKFFINLANGSLYSRSYYAQNASGTSSSMKNVSRAVMINLPIPLPPLPEQQRIVAKVDQLMALCDGLEGAIATATEKQQALLEATTAEF
ncbi:MAG: restriction endonuclease subunit S [Cyanobacteria bacterium P01_F01_bin.150]